MMNTTLPKQWKVGEWSVIPSRCRIERVGESQAVEPKVMDLLVLLASRPGEVATHEEILSALWPGVIVGDDTLARCVSKLRRAFGDDPKAPTYVETVPKRGYRIIAPIDLVVQAPTIGRVPFTFRTRLMISVAIGIALVVAWIGLQVGRDDSTSALIARAKDSYFQFTRTENETAIDLYETVLSADPDNAQAQAGLATALVQQVIRWPNAPGETDYTRTTLGEAIATGRLRTPDARIRLARAHDLAVRATRLSPNDYFAQQALGLTLAAAGDLDAARTAHTRAVALNADAWGALINLGDLEDIEGRPKDALPFYERAYAAMERAYSREPQRIRPWQGAVGILIGDRHRAVGDSQSAEIWYRRVLEVAPLHAEATSRLAELLAARGARAEAKRICTNLMARTGPEPECVRIAANDESSK